MGRSPAELSRKSETSVRLTGRRVAAPWKITSSILPPRSSRADCSPSTQRTASDTFDLPQPLGPTMAVTPSSNSRVTVSANDLKPESSSLVSFMRQARDGGWARRRRERRRNGGKLIGSGAAWGPPDDEVGAAQLFPALLGQFPGGIGPDHHPVPLFRLGGLEHRGGESVGLELLGELPGPFGVLGEADLDV